MPRHQPQKRLAEAQPRPEGKAAADLRERGEDVGRDGSQKGSPSPSFSVQWRLPSLSSLKVGYAPLSFELPEKRRTGSGCGAAVLRVGAVPSGLLQ